MQGYNESDHGPEGSRQQAVTDAHGNDAEVGVAGGESENAVTEEGDDDGEKDEGDVAPDTVDQVANDRCDECRH